MKNFDISLEWFSFKKKKEIRIKIFGDLYDLREDSEEDRGK